jgi:cobalt transporter subunit CbtB
MKMTEKTFNSIASSDERIFAQSSVVAPAVLALLLGAFLVLGTGFAHSDTIHNAAHDSRHSFAFPCH